MDTLTPLTLSQAVSALQLGLQSSGRMGEIAPLLSATVRAAGPLETWNLPQLSARVLTRIRDGGVVEETEGLRALALLAARIGAKETAEVRRAARTAVGSEIGSFDAIQDLMARHTFTSKSPPNGFWARSVDPSDGFSPFLTPQGTQVAFFSNPGALGVPWAEIIREHWQNGLGLVAFRNERARVCGMIFVHGVGRVAWSRPERRLWLSSGGSMAFDSRSLSFSQALTRVVDKGVAMTYQWRSVDQALKKAGHRTPTGLGGSKGILMHAGNGKGLENGLKVYAEVLSILGITLTGSEEGLDLEAAEKLARLAPLNVIGSKYAHYRGHTPLIHTAEGIHQALRTVHARLLGDREAPVLLVGYGGIGSLLRRALLQDRRLPLTGVVDADVGRLCGLRDKAGRLPLFQDRSIFNPSTFEAARMKWRKVTSERGLARILERAEGTQILSPNGGPHAIDFDVAYAMIACGVRAVAGAANNQAAYDAFGSPDSIAWILQAGGVFHAADFVVNSLGATAVISDAVQLGYNHLQRVAHKMGEEVQTEIESAYHRGLPPFVHERERTARAWNALISGGEGKGGRFEFV